MKQVSGKELAKLLQKKGWELRRIHGSHHIFSKAGVPELLVVPIHRNEPLKTGLLRALMKLADLTEADL